MAHEDDHDSSDGEVTGDGVARAAMDELTAHLDRGWDLVQRGDLAGAERAARGALELDGSAPEIHTLLGAIAATNGDTDAAFEHYDKAIALDPEYVDPLLYSAELHLWPREEYDEAIELCEQALELAEEEDEYLDALLLKAEAELAKGDEAAARHTLAELPPTSYPDPNYHLRAGRSWLDLGDLDAAEKEVQRALAQDPQLTDALHALGIIQEERGDGKNMVKTYLQVREADLREAPPPWGIPRERFEKLAEEALAELPERIRTLLENVPIIAADYPALELVAEGSDPRMMGFFSGIPYPEKSSISGTPPHLDCVFLYQRNIERVCQTSDEVEDEIRKTLFHETGHFFGLSEEELEAMGLG